jgi:thiol-disulfide isomerase/thioredoxin
MNKWHKLLIVIALIGAVVFIVEHKKRQGFVCAGGVCPPPDTTGETATREASAQKPLPRLVDLGAGKCVACKMMTPILDELKTTHAGKLDVVFIDVWENKEAGEQYGIRMIPTQIFYDAEGKELFRHEGFFAKDDILAKWKELGVDL